MAAVTTTRPIDAAQLDGELGGGGISTSSDGQTTEVTCHDESVTEAALQTAVDAHVPAEPPPSPTSLLQSQVDEITDLLLELI